MQFASFDFALFFIGCFLLSWFFVARNTMRKLVLLGASYGFIATFDWRFAGLIFAASVCNFLLGSLTHGAQGQLSKRLFVALAIVFNLALLAVFKYFGFFAEALSPFLSEFGLARDVSWLQIAVPIGISFFTLQSVGYMVDIYRGKMAAEKSFIDFQLFLTFFPKMIAGPLVKAPEFLAQFKTQASLTRDMVGRGFVLILIGLTKKLVVADMLATHLVDKVFADPAAHSSLDVLFAVYGLAIQLYCDISGYCDLAIGCALLLGVKITENFDRPYSAVSLREFWSRWYTSLSGFFIEYVYRPMGGASGGLLQAGRNIVLTFLFAAWWHGSGVTFVVFGLYHAGLVSCEYLISKIKPAPATASVGYGSAPIGQIVKTSEKGMKILAPVLSTLLTFHVVCIGWVFFKSETWSTTEQIFSALVNGDMSAELMTPYLVILLIAAFSVHFLSGDFWSNLASKISRLNAIFLGLLFGLGVLVIQVLASAPVKPFIYSVL